MRPLTIGFANEHYLPGISRAFMDPARGLAARGHRVVFFAATAAGGPQPGESRDGVEFHTWPIPERLRSWRYLRVMRASFARAIARFLAAERPDCWYFNGPLASDAILRVPGARAVPAVYAFHSPWRAEWDLKAADAFRGPRRLFERWFGGPLRDAIERRGLAHARRVFTLSEYMHGLLRRHHPGLDDRRWRLVRGWVDLDRFHDRLPRAEARRRLGLDPNRRLLLTVRRLERRMGVDLLIDAFAALAPHYPDVDLEIGGTGTIERELHAHAARLGLGPRLRFRGYVPDEELPLLYRAADCFVLPSQALEGFGLVSAEALAAGTPVLGTPVGGTVEVLDGLAPGLLLADGTRATLEAALARWLQPGALDETLARRCRAWAEQRFALARALDEIEALLADAVAEGAPSCPFP